MTFQSFENFRFLPLVCHRRT